jgi:hypothetical protein
MKLHHGILGERLEISLVCGNGVVNYTGPLLDKPLMTEEVCRGIANSYDIDAVS